jgi:uroporphyrinogen decarboxylase
VDQATLRNVPLARPRPDVGRFLSILKGERAAVPTPLVEYLIDDAVLKAVVTGILGRPWAEPSAGPEARRAWLDSFLEVWHRLGYDIVRFELSLPFPENKVLAADPGASNGRRRSWADEHRGRIASWEDFERYPWPKIAAFDFSPFEYLAGRLPDGMGLVVSHGGGLFEHLSWIMSLEGLCFALRDDPPLVEAVADRVGGLLTDFNRHLLGLDRVAGLFPGDDMGFRSGTLIAPDDLRRLVLPWHKRWAEMAHAAGRPYFLHSCGNLALILEDLIRDVGLDGKHSFEDAILPAEEFQSRWGGSLAVLGGVDLNILSNGSVEDVRRRTRELIRVCGGRGRFAVGSGNSIPSYVPVGNYLAMVDEALEQELG